MPKGPDIRDVPVTAVLMELDLRFNGGTLSDEKVGRVWEDVMRAFQESAQRNGLQSTWCGAIGCQQPAVFERGLKKRCLTLDPVVA